MNDTIVKNDSGNTTLNEKFDGKKKKGAVYRSTEFDKDFIDVFLNQSFLGVVSLEVSKVANEGAPTAYMAAKKNDRDYELELGYNPDFFRSLTPKERQGVIVHELYHLVLRHITTRIVADDRFNMLWNVATDLAINSIIGGQNLPAFCLLPGKRPTRRDPKTGKIVDSGDHDLCAFIETAPPL